MSAAGVQRAIVRMLFDPRFRDAVYDDAAVALAGCDVTVVERGWLVHPDRRAYATDALRQRRMLTALEEELPCATAWARHDGRDPLGFFGSQAFHRAIEERSYLVQAFAQWLVEGGSVEVATTGALEGALAAARRGLAERPASPSHLGGGRGAESPAADLVSTDRPASLSHLGGGRGAESPAAALVSEPACVVCSPRVRMVETTDVALIWWERVRAAIAGRQDLPPLPRGEAATALVVVLPDGTSTAEMVTDEIAALLRGAARPIARAALAARLGLPADEADEIIDEFVSDGLLVPA
jgi:hypothetical protein